jgi:hypothetical protein
MKYIYNKVRVIILSKNKSLFTIRLIVGIILGGILGFLYFLLTNFTPHPPAIASTPWFSTMYGVILGGLLSKK